MSAVTAPVPLLAADGQRSRATRARALLVSEWTKTRSVRSSYWSLAAAVVAIIGFGVLFCALYSPQRAFGEVAPWQRSLRGLVLAQIAVGVLGVLSMTGEFGTGMIRATFCAVPQRIPVLAAKGAVFASLTFVISLAATFAAFFAGQGLLSRYGRGVSLGDPGVLRAVIGCTLYLTVLALFALALGTLIRHSAGAISALFGILFVLPLLSAALPFPWSNDVAQILPGDAGLAIADLPIGPGGLTPWVGFGVFCAWTVALLVAAAWTLQRRDV